MRYLNLVLPFLTGVFLTLLLFSCNKENEKAVILLSPAEIFLPAGPSDIVVIEVTCSSPYEMKQLTIKSREEGAHSALELDTSISGKNFHMQYEYLVPDIIENTSIILEFNLIDASNMFINNFRVIEVSTSTHYLMETAGHEMFSGNSGKQDGYNLITGTPQFRHLADSTILHIADTTNADTLLKRWISPAGSKFVRFNGFDYANCTDVSTKNAFSAGLKIDFLDQIAEGDIYLAKIQTQKFIYSYLAIKIVDIKDEPGSGSDRYVFNIKK